MPTPPVDALSITVAEFAVRMQAAYGNCARYTLTRINGTWVLHVAFSNDPTNAFQFCRADMGAALVAALDLFVPENLPTHNE